MAGRKQFFSGGVIFMEEFDLNAKVVFGLVKQGHIPVIEEMLSVGKNWDEIAAKIGWLPATAREYYERYAQRQKNPESELVEICPLLAKSVEILNKILPKLSHLDADDAHRIIYQSSDYLLSAPKKRSK